MFNKSAYQFTEKVVIAGEEGHAHVETIAKPVKMCPHATTRVIARWVGKVKRNTVILVNGEGMRVLRMFAMEKGAPVAHFLCVAEASEVRA